ncbi:MAG TPA: MBL fold metallo-hydrolase [Spirochaetes bacterium]|mgnify:CR=1 FL=1|nr:MBL fold metallo-hydrolase [Spirochaetota bacterium]
MKIEFVGGARTVTGSSYIVKNDEFAVMVDCGMFQGRRDLKERNFLKLIYAPEKIDALVLTHAHIDHSGLIPKLVKDGFKSPIYATEATTELCSIMLPDSAHIQEMDAEWINRKQKKLGRDPVDPLYTAEDAQKALERFRPVKYGDMVRVHPSVSVRFRDAGHILGSAFVEMWVKDKGKTIKIVFSGDVGTRDQAIIRDPETADEADILLIESTYGDRLHKSKKDTYEEFKQIINTAHNRNGNIVIPSFAIERTQEIIYTLGRLFKAGEIPRMPVYIDSPLAISATEIFRHNQQMFDDETMRIILSGETPLDFPNLHFTRTIEESKRLNKEAKGAIIISASGMCTAGRIKYHLQNNLYRPESSVIFVGFQAEGTLGRKLVDGEKRVRIYGEDVAVKAEVHTLGGFSAHADRDGLLDWMGSIKNENLKVFVVHGEEKASLSFADAVRDRYGYETRVPMWGETIDPRSMEGETVTPGGEPTETLNGEVDALRKAMDRLVEKLGEARKGSRVYQAKRLEQDLADLTEMVRSLADDIG